MNENILNQLTEIINLEAIRELPKATEHFISDIHGEFEAFDHLRRNCSGIIRIKAKALFSEQMDEEELNHFCFSIYYPEDLIMNQHYTFDEWQLLLTRLVQLTRNVSSKYTRSKVRKALPEKYAYILEELLYQYDQHTNKSNYYHTIFKTIIDWELAPTFATMLSYLIQRFVVDHLHVLGDIYDRGANPDKIMDVLISLPSVDITLGNHDIIWMGAYSGNFACLATVLRIALRYGHTHFLEENYGISLERLKKFATTYYQDNLAFRPKIDHPISEKELFEITVMHQAITMMQFKLEGQLIQRRPEFNMAHRDLLTAINFKNNTVKVENTRYPLSNECFQLIDHDNPNELSLNEELILLDLMHQFQHSKKMQEHMHFLHKKGRLYLTYNDNLLFHGCLPVDQNGNYLELTLENQSYSGKSLMELFESHIDHAFNDLNAHNDFSTDLIWYLWCGPASTLFGKDTMRTFERYFIEDKTIHKEVKNPYYDLRHDESFCLKLLKDFNLPNSGYIINGHTPVNTKKGETPIKANGKMLVIDGGLSSPYQKVTGTAGYTLVDNSHEVYLVAHHPFTTKEAAIKNYYDILPNQMIVMKRPQRQTVRYTDIGKELTRQADLLKEQLQCELPN